MNIRITVNENVSNIKPVLKKKKQQQKKKKNKQTNKKKHKTDLKLTVSCAGLQICPVLFTSIPFKLRDMNRFTKSRLAEKTRKTKQESCDATSTISFGTHGVLLQVKAVRFLTWSTCASIMGYSKSHLLTFNLKKDLFCSIFWPYLAPSYRARVTDSR